MLDPNSHIEYIDGQSVAIFLASYNGEKYIDEQIASIVAQTHRNWKIYVSDDGSSDGTVSLFERWLAVLGPSRFEIRRGPSKGYVRNFMSLVHDSRIRANFYAYSDQDDIWLPNKLSSALIALGVCQLDKPALYCGRTAYISSSGEACGFSVIRHHEPSFRNALVECIAGGNTMVYNSILRDALITTGVVDTISHDWWTYLLVTGVGGCVIYDREPLVLYRQHRDALVGGNTGFIARLRRFVRACRGQLIHYSNINLVCLRAAVPLLTIKAREEMDSFASMRNVGVMRRINLFLRGRFFRQSALETLLLFALVLFARI